MKQKQQSVIRVILFALLVGLFSPTQSAAPADNVVKTFIIRDAANALLPNAKVRMYWSDNTTGVYRLGDAVTSNSSGVATIQLPINSENAYYTVFPAAGDTTNAIQADTFISADRDETVNVKLVTSNFVLDIQKSDGTAMGVSSGAYVGWPASSSTSDFTWTTLPRSGAFGVKLPNDLSTSQNYQIGLYQFTEAWTSGQYSWQYGLKASGTAGSQTYVVYTDTEMTTVLPPSGQTHVLKYSGANISGTLKNADGSQITLTSGVEMNVSIAPVSTAPCKACGGNDFFNSTTSPHADWKGRVLGPAGKYIVRFAITGSLTLPSFVSYLWKNSSGGFSTTETGVYTTANPAELEFRLPSTPPNFAYKTVLSGTTTQVPMLPTLEVKTPGTNDYTFLSGGSLAARNGLGSAVLPDGDYRFTVDPSDQALTTITATISVVSGVATVKNSAGQVITPTAGVYSFSPGSPNVKFKAVSASNTSTVINNSWIEVFKGADGSGGSVASRDSGTTGAGFTLDDGIYMVRANPNDWQTYKEKTWVLTMAAGVASIPGLTASGGIFSLPLPGKNFQFKLQKPNGDALLASWINYCILDPISQKQLDCMGDGVDNSGNGGGSLLDGTYAITVYPGIGNETLSSRTYVATVVGGAVTGIVGSTFTSGRWVLVASSSNISGSLMEDLTHPLTFATNQGVSVDVQQEVNGNWNWIGKGSWRSSPGYGFNLNTEGHYRILANPRGFTDKAWSYSEEFWIAANGKMSKISAAAATSGSDSLTNLDITVRTANLKMKINNPLTSQPLMFGWVSVIKKEDNGNQMWIMNADLDSRNPGLTGAYLEDGNYRLELNPQQGNNMIAGLARRNFDAVVSGGSVSVTLNGAPVSTADGRFELAPSSANITGRVTDLNSNALGGAENKWVNINVQKYIPNENRWNWTNNWSNTDANGNFSLSVSEAGKFRLRIEPNGYANSAVTLSSEFIIAPGSESTFSKNFQSIQASAPSLRVSVLSGADQPALQFTNIEVRKNNNWIDWANTMQNGIASISFAEAGQYQLIVQPSQNELNLGKARKTYDVVATADSNGIISATVTGLTATNGVYSLLLGTGTLAGTVFGTQTPTPETIANTAVVPIDLTTNQEKWEYAVWTSSTGKWAMTLPQGTYSIIAKAPYGGSTYGNSDPIATVTVDSNGTAALTGDAESGRTPSTFNISLKAPTWTGIVKAPTGETGIAYAQVCLNNNDYWNCTSADANGNWALSAQTGIDTYSENAFLVVGDYRNGVYPEIRFEGAAAVQGVLGLPAGEVTPRVIRFVGANVHITVTGAEGAPVPYVWVGLDRPNVGWLGGNQTNAEGVANLYVADLTKEINVRIDLNNNKQVAANFASTMKNFTDAQVLANTADTGHLNEFVTSIALDAPNLRGVLREPTIGLTEGVLSPYSWVELFLESSGQWMGGSSTDENGAFSLNVPKPLAGSLEYTMIVNPPWSNSGTSSRNQYSVVVNDNNEVTVTMKSDNSPVSTTVAGSTSYYALALAQPSVRGIVVKAGDVAVRDSWVVPINSATGEWYWQQGTNSKSGGAFGLTLGDGQYNIQARVPWNTANLADSAMCAVTVTGGSISTLPGGCVQTGGTIKLALRAPNLTMTLKLGTTAVAFANVGIALGNWSVNAQSNKNGEVSLFVDRAAIMAANPTLTGTNKFWVWVDPPYGTSDMVRWDCQSGAAKPLCSSLLDFVANEEYNNGNPLPLGEITVLGPNTRLQVLDPSTPAHASVGANAWVGLLSYDSAHPEWGQRWLGGSNTDSSGGAAFNIDVLTSSVTSGPEIATTRYKLEVNPPWNKKVVLSQKIYDNLLLSDINGKTFDVGIPNATITVKVPGGGSDNKWGWIGIEEVNAGGEFVNRPIEWVGGFGLNDTGTAAVTLKPSKRYKITANPAYGRAGTTTTCLIDTDISTVITRVVGLCSASNNIIVSNQLQINLSNGNVTGYVKSPLKTATGGDIWIKNATVYANVADAASGNEDFAVVTSTLADGSFGLNLDVTKTWVIKILPFNLAGATPLAVKILDAPVFDAGVFDYQVITLAVK